MGLPGDLDKVLLVGHEAEFPAEHRGFHRDGGWFGHVLPSPVGNARLRTTRKPVQLGHHRLGKGPRQGMGPQALEFRIHPVAGVRGIVLPDQLVVQGPSGVGFVGAPQETGAPSLGVADHPGLAVDEPEGVVGKDPHLQLRPVSAGQEGDQAGQAVGAPADQLVRIVLQERQFLGLFGGVRIGGADIRIADHADTTLHPFQSFPRQFQQGRVEVAGDAVVGQRPRKAFRQKAPARFVPGPLEGVALDHEGALRRTYRCFGLLGLSGRVGSNKPACSKGIRISLRKYSRSLSPI